VDSTAETESTEKQPYEPPRLVSYGTIEDLTTTTASGTSDGPAGPSLV
jgi:hypothetical protein